MLRSVAVSRIQQGLGFRTDRAAEVILMLQEAQRDLEKGKTLPKFLLAEDQALALVQGNNAITLPSNFLRRSSILISYLPLYSTFPKRIPWRDYESAAMAYQAYNPGGPAVVSLRSTSLWFQPVADRNYTLTWTYYKKAALLTTDVENEWLDDDNMPEYLIGEAGLRIARDIRNEKATALFTSMQQRSRVALFGETVMDEADDQVTMGGNS